MLGDGAGSEREIEVEIERIRARMAAIEAERTELEATLSDLANQRAAMAQINHQPNTVRDALTVTTTSSSTDKVALFRRLFAGRPDVFPLRWENQKIAKSGYAPACANEWVRGICGKPRVKCGECPHQAFIPVSDDMTSTLKGALHAWVTSQWKSTIGVIELTGRAEKIGYETFRFFEAFALCGIIYLVLTACVVGLIRGMRSFFAVPGLAG